MVSQYDSRISCAYVNMSAAKLSDNNKSITDMPVKMAYNDRCYYKGNYRNPVIAELW